MKFHFKTNPGVFYPATILISLFVLICVIFPNAMESFFGWLQNFVIDGFGWFYVLSVAAFLLFVLWLPLSRYAHVKLGKDDDEPEFSLFAWFAMLFSAGMGIGLVFYGVAEPILHYGNPPFSEGATPAAAREALNLTFFHWGLHAWAIYIVIGLSLAYFAYRHELPLTIRSTLYPLIGERVHGIAGHLIDILAVFGTLFGLATSLGLGVMQINSGLDYLGILSVSTFNQIFLILGISLAATLSVLSGVGNGIRRLSELNMGVAALLLLFILLFGPTALLLNSMIQSTGSYAANIVNMTFRTDAFIGLEWQKAWTMFYWGWWISWSPFVGMFIARVSRGRTIREFVCGVLFVPTLLTFFWMTVFGSTAIHLDTLTSGAIREAVDQNIATAVFATLNELPFSIVSTILTTLVVAIFFVTSSDSGSLVMDILSSGGRHDTPAVQKTFWAMLVGMVAAVLLLVGGLKALQAAAITTALPFALVMVFICMGLYKALRAERTTMDPLQELWGVVRRLPSSATRSLFSVPAAASTREGVFGSARTEQAKAVGASDLAQELPWQERLSRITTEPDSTDHQTAQGLVEAKETLRQFFDQTVRPAFEQLKGELEKQGRSAQFECVDDRAEIIVFSREVEEFRFGIQGHVREEAVFAFPKFDHQKHEIRATAEVVLRSGKRTEKNVTQYDQQRIIDDFLLAYGRWMGW